MQDSGDGRRERRRAERECGGELGGERSGDDNAIALIDDNAIAAVRDDAIAIVGDDAIAALANQRFISEVVGGRHDAREWTLSAPVRIATGWLLRLGLGGLFVLAGVLKLAQPTTFATEIVYYSFLPQLAPYLAATLPMIEIALGLALVAAPVPWRRAAALAMAGLLAVFTVAVVQAVARGINIDCGCFGGGSGPVSGWTIARDLALLAAAVAAVWLSAPKPAPPAPSA